MDLDAFATRVLAATSLTDKLAPPRLGERASALPSLPDDPGRPPGLALRDTRPRPAFPSDERLAEPEQAALALHFFANHELLALELMALALLRFPDAEPAFRRGLVGVMREEQRHLAAYVERMGELGVALGDVPVSAYFWDALAGAATPTAFIAGLSLTFEQANLDFAAHYARAFRAAGDTKTATLLDEVLADEIGHVAHGVRWFRTWEPDGTLWDRWREALPAPLTPRRARGIGFEVRARRQAGLDDATITRVATAGGSRGRPPVLHRFDPEPERCAGGLPSSAASPRIARDLELLAAFIAGPDDAVLVGEPPDPTFLNRLAEAGFALPEIVTAIDDRRWGGAAPWGPSPDASRALASAGAAPWDPAFRRLYDKSWAAAIPSIADELAAVERGGGDRAGGRGTRRGAGDGARTELGGGSAVQGPVALSGSQGLAAPERWLERPEDRPRVARTLGEVRDAIAQIGDRPLVTKAPLSTAGRDRRRSFDLAFVERTLERMGSVVIEPWLDRFADLSAHYEGDRLVGITRFFTDPGGGYLGTWIGRPTDGLPPEAARLLTGDGRDPRRLRTVFAQVGATLRARAPELDGPYSVDAMIYRAPDGLRLRPIVELNPRRTMSRVALSLQRHVRPGVAARFDLMAPRDFVACPAVRVEGQLVAGRIALTDPRRASLRVAVLSVGDAAQRR